MFRKLLLFFVLFSIPAAGQMGQFSGSSQTGTPLSSGGTNNLSAGVAACNTSNLTGQGDVALGHAALNACTSASTDVAVGDAALSGCTTCSTSTIVGSGGSGSAITDAINNSAFGSATLTLDVHGSDNVAVGFNALNHFANTGSTANTAVGGDSQNYNGSGLYNATLGHDTMWGGDGGVNGNSCSQDSSGGTNRYTAAQNVAVGEGAYCNASTGNDNVAVGWRAAVGMKTGSQNVIIGSQAGLTGTIANFNNSGSNNIWIGYQAGPPSTTQVSDSIVIAPSGGNVAVAHHAYIGDATITNFQLVFGAAAGFLRIDGSGNLSSAAGSGTSANPVTINSSTTTGAIPIFDASGNVVRASSNLQISTTVPTILATGCGGPSGATISIGTNTSAFTINTGTTPGSACTVTMPAAANDWSCSATDVTTQSTSIFLQKVTSTSTTSITVTNYSDVAVATAFTASDKIKMLCIAE